MHQPIPEQGRWLASVVQGAQAYYGVPGNYDAVHAFRTQVTRHWRRALRRRSQKARVDWTRMNRIVTRWLPPIRITHPFPEAALRRQPPKVGAQCGSPARWDLRGGPPARAVPTRSTVLKRVNTVPHSLEFALPRGGPPGQAGLAKMADRRLPAPVIASLPAPVIAWLGMMLH